MNDDDEYISFEKTMEILKTDEEGLIKLISVGEVKAFRHGDKYEFIKEEIEEKAAKK